MSRPVSVYLNTDYKYDPYPEKEGVFTSYIDLAEPTSGKRYPVVECAAGGKGKMVDFRSAKPLYKKNEKGVQVFTGTEKDISVYEFDVPSDGIYYIVFRGLVPKHSKPLTNSFFLSLNNAPFVEQYLTLSFGADVSWVWPKLPQSLNIYECKALKLKKGKNILKIAPRRDIYLDAACLTNDVRIFVTR